MKKFNGAQQKDSHMSKKILIADDDQDIVKVLSFQFQKNGFEVIAAYDGEESVAKAFSEHPDLIILDYHMPKLNGIEVFEKVKAQEEFKNTPVLFFTGRLDIDNEKISSFEKAELVFKPCDFSDLLTICEKML